MAACPQPPDLSRVNPTTVTDRYWVYCRPPVRHLLGETYGKWLVFKPKASGALDEIWHTIRRCVENGDFGDGCTGAKCSTALENPDEAPIGSPNGVICVYTTAETVDEVGLMLVEKVRQTMRYKTDETTLKGLYAHKGHGKVTIRTIYWNNGKPSIGPRSLPPDVNPTSVTDDYWVYCKPPSDAEARDSQVVYGKWQIFEPMASLDETWHVIRRSVERGELGKGCTNAWCSTALKPEYIPPNSNGVIEVSTTKEGMDEVGMKLINKVERDIQYRYKEFERPPRTSRYQRKRPMKTSLYWNSGEPSFEKL